ncbi:MAG: DUF5067 domain-containing protein [Lachnospiraceae bacterium]
MKKIYNFIPSILCVIILFSSCGKTETDIKTGQSTLPSPAVSSSEGNNNITSGGNKKAGNEPEASSETETPIVTENPEQSQEPEENNKTIEAVIDTKSGYADDNRQINVIGLKTYKKLKSKLYKDKAAKNKEFLVLFLEINNKLNDKDYINVNYLSTKVDGKEIKNSVLFNEPEGFQTIFKNIEPGETLRGFIVWEVPEDWKKIEVIYDGWKDSSNLSLNCTFTPDDYFDPPQYS